MGKTGRKKQKVLAGIQNSCYNGYERRGRINPLSKKRRGRPPKLNKKVEEGLIAENQRLRMEIDYLKK